MQRSRFLAVVVVAVPAALALSFGVASAERTGVEPAPKSPNANLAAAESIEPASCPTPRHQKLDKRKGTFFKYNDVKIRRGPYKDLCIALGQGDRGDRVQLHCVAMNHNSLEFWTFLENLTTGVKGWVRNDLLTQSARYAC